MREGVGNVLSDIVTFNFNIFFKFPWHLFKDIGFKYLVKLGVSLNFTVHLYIWDGN